MSIQKSRALAAKRLVGHRLREARRAKGLSQVQLAQQMERSQGVVSDWEKGQRGVSLPELWVLAGVVGVTLEHLAGPPASDWEWRWFRQWVDQFEREAGRPQAPAPAVPVEAPSATRPDEP